MFVYNMFKVHKQMTMKPIIFFKHTTFQPTRKNMNEGQEALLKAVFVMNKNAQKPFLSTLEH